MNRKTFFTLSVVIFSSLAGIATLGASEIAAPEPGTLDLKTIFDSCPIIYTLLIFLSISATAIWLYSIFTLRIDELMPSQFIHTLRAYLSEKHYDEALDYCQREGNFASKIISSGLSSRNHGSQYVMDTIHSEGRRLGNAIWHKIGLLNDIAVIAPMLGLLGTVLGLFFAFYDTTAATENITSIFDGLGIAIGTTVLGLIVAIMSMVFYTILKYRVANLLDNIENESMALVSLIDKEGNDRPMNKQ